MTEPEIMGNCIFFFRTPINEKQWYMKSTWLKCVLSLAQVTNMEAKDASPSSIGGTDDIIEKDFCKLLLIVR